MKKTKTKIITTMIVLASLVLVAGWAYGNNDGKSRKEAFKAKALKACVGKQAGDSVEFTGLRGNKLSATCEDVNGQLLALPEMLRERMK